MANARKRARQRRRAKTLIGSMREFLTSDVFKQVRNSSRRRKLPRWDLHPLLYILLLTTYCCGDKRPVIYWFGECVTISTGALWVNWVNCLEWCFPSTSNARSAL